MIGAVVAGRPVFQMPKLALKGGRKRDGTAIGQTQGKNSKHINGLYKFVINCGSDTLENKFSVFFQSLAFNRITTVFQHLLWISGVAQGIECSNPPSEAFNRSIRRDADNRFNQVIDISVSRYCC